MSRGCGVGSKLAKPLTDPPGQARHLVWLMAGLVMALLMLPVATVAQDAAADELPAPGTLLEPGRYRSSAAGPSIEFRVEEGWISTGPTDGPVFTLGRAGQPGTVLTVTRFDGVAFVESCDPTSMTDVDVSVSRLIEIIAGNPFLNPAPPELADIDGNLGLRLDVATPELEDCALPYLLLWALPMQDGEFVQVAGQQSRFIVVDVDGDVIVIAIESLPGVPFGSLLDASMQIVDSMRITPADDEAPSPHPAGSEPPASPAPVAPAGDDSSS